MMDKDNIKKKILKPVPLLDGIEEIRQDFEERIEQGDTTYGLEILDDCVETIRKGSITFIIASPNCLDLATRVLTSSGWKLMRDLSSEDKVIGKDGKPYDILSFTDTDPIECYKIRTTDGREIISSYNHRFSTYHFGSLNHSGSNRGYIYRTLTAEQLHSKMKSTWRKGKLFLETIDYQYAQDKELPIPPYVLGVLIGDGCLTSSGLVYCKPSLEVFNKVKYYIPDREVKFLKNKRIVSILNSSDFKDYLKRVGLNTLSHKKFIPKDYKFNISRKQKEELLQGLLDTDGHQALSYNEYSTVSEQLAKDVQELAWSLGYRCTIKTRMGSYKKDGVKIKTRLNYRVIISNRRKKAPCVIDKVEYVGLRPTRCITTNAPDELFVVNDYLLTKNTGKSLLGQTIACNLAKQDKKVMVCSCEMGAGLLMERQLKTILGIRMSDIRQLYNSRRDEANNLLDAVYDKEYSYLRNIDICETGGATVYDIIDMLNSFPEFEYIVIDYIQRIKGFGSEYENITLAARELQTYARETGKRIIICSQASRSSTSEAKGDSKNNPDGMKVRGKGSGSIEEDGDVGISLLELYENGIKKILVTLFKNRYGDKKNVTYKYRLNDRLQFTLEGKDIV